MMKNFSKLCLLVTAVFACMPLTAQVISRILPASTIHISGTSTLSDWVVKSQQVSGEMMVAPPAKKADRNAVPAGTIKNAKVILEVAGIKSEKGETMDNKMYVALKEENHPQIAFVLTRPVELVTVPATISAAGEVTLAGVTRPMTFDLKLTHEEGVFHLQGSRPLKLSDFEIEPPSAMFGQIVAGNDIVVELNLFFGK